jgi:predicted ATP-grasp superfamily ATP-dependent carboligase
MAFVLLVDGEGQLVATVQQEADGVWPIDHGVSVRARTVPVDPELAERIGALVAELGWTGLAELQFVGAPGDHPSLIDFNGRFYGSLALAVGAGVNLPTLWAALATGRPVPEAVTALPGVRYQWLYGDLRRCIDEGRRGILERSWDALSYSRGAVHSVISLNDLRPAARYVRLLIAPLLERVGR